MSNDWRLLYAAWFVAIGLMFMGPPLDSSNPRTYGAIGSGVFFGICLGRVLWHR
jgi:lipopolysaccharide export LptBFGC system permease protein LptF